MSNCKSASKSNEATLMEIGKKQDFVDSCNNNNTEPYSYKTSQFMNMPNRYGLLDAIKSSCSESVGNRACGYERTVKCQDKYPFVGWVENQLFKDIKCKVEEAVKNQKIFLIRGELPGLKRVLEGRGWIQKYEPSRTRSLPNADLQNLEIHSLRQLHLQDGSLNEPVLMHMLLKPVQPNFIWDCSNNFVEWEQNIADDVLLNKLKNPALYTSKLGMAHILQEAHWLFEENVADVMFPRCYNPSRELSAFVQDFKRCAALALLKRFVNRMRDIDVSGSQDSCQAVSRGQNEVSLFMEKVLFAIRCCENYINELEHKDIDCLINEENCEEEWMEFFKEFDRLLIETDNFIIATHDSDQLHAYHEAAKSILVKLKDTDPQFELNGERNLWIVKPSELCCGSGIFITHELQKILQRVKNKPKNYYVIQKYIERPFLVFKTKFDIRQWFLVTSTFPLTIWSFKEALLRLSSKPYTTETYHEVIHLCNTAVQEKYDFERKKLQRSTLAVKDEESSIRDQGWDCERLNEHLKSLGYEGEPYYDRIYPKMLQAIVLTMLAAQDFLDRRSRSFELFGADFMVMEDLTVWLIEINTNPRMHPPSSRISQRLYDSVLDSLIKVILDQPLDSEADVGNFELIYKQELPKSMPNLGSCFFAFGKPIKIMRDLN